MNTLIQNQLHIGGRWCDAASEAVFPVLNPADDSVIITVADGTDLSAEKLARVLTNDPAMGVLRHVDAGYDEAIEVADRLHVRVPTSEG